MAQSGGGSSKGSGRRSSGGSSRSGGRSSSGRSTSARSSSSRSSSSRSKSTRSASARKAAASKGGKARARQQKARKGAQSTARTAGRGARRAGVEAKTVAELREALRKNLIRPFDIVLLSRDRIEEVMSEAVERGRVTADDAQQMANGLIQRGRKQTNEVLKDLEQLMGRGRDRIEGRTAGARRAGTGAAKGARKQVEGAARGARSRAVKAADPVLSRADRVRRAAGVGPNFPVTGYDDLTANQIQGRLSGLTPAELRKVRDYERRHANRKSVLSSIESKLS
jgi:polyhydroxyalkanoate synthesis regulator phasin